MMDLIFKLEIRCAGDAFADAPNHEVAGIMHELAYNLVENAGTDGRGNLMDGNGNDCGYWVYMQRPTPKRQ